MLDLSTITALAVPPVLAATLYIMRNNRRANTMSEEKPAPTIEQVEKESMDVAALRAQIREARQEDGVPREVKRARIKALKRKLRDEKAELAEVRKSYHRANRKPIVVFERLRDQVQLELLRALKLHVPGEAQIDAAVDAVVAKLDALIEFGPVVEQVSDAGLALIVRPVIRGMAVKALEELEELGENSLEE